MRRTVALLVVVGLGGCAGTPVLPHVGDGAQISPSEASKSERALPSEPEAQWHLEPKAEGIALELRF